MVVAVRKQKMNPRRATWLLVGAGAAMVAGRLVERGMETGWRAWKGEDPPEKPWRSGEAWPQALAWTALSAAAVATAELVAPPQRTSRTPSADGEASASRFVKHSPGFLKLVEDARSRIR